MVRRKTARRRYETVPELQDGALRSITALRGAMTDSRPKGTVAVRLNADSPAEAHVGHISPRWPRQDT
jgi:hypothetical protein